MAQMVGGAVLSASLQVLFDRIASREFINFFLGKKHGEKLLKELKLTLLTLKVVLNDAEAKQVTNEAVTDWLDELKDALYHADDLVDEITTIALQSKLEAAWRCNRNQVLSFASTSIFWSEEEMESRMEEIIDRLGYFVTHKDILGSKDDVAGKQLQLRSTSSVVDEFDVCGRDSEKEKIIQLLLSDKPSCNGVGVVTIVGMGGIGKTTLAQLVFNDARVDANFDTKAWVCVNSEEEFDVCSLTRKIAEAFGELTSHTNDLELLHIKLKNVLRGKKFLLVLDDVWSESYEKWDVLRKPFGVGSNRSRIVVTTRIKGVARVMGTWPSHEMEQLSFEDCWSVFAKHAFEIAADANAHPNLKMIGKSIVGKCKGLPLALKSLGGLLHGKLDPKEWEDVLKSEIWDLKCDILPALRLSYQYLPPHLKQCFAYCSIFPKDYKFGREELVELWIAQDFVQQSKDIHGRSVEDAGSSYFSELLSRSFFQESTSTNYRGIYSCIIMHDLIHDLAQHVSRDFYFIFQDGKPLDFSKKVRHFSYITSSFNVSRILERVSENKCLRTFASFQKFNLMSLHDVALENLLSTLRCLRVLSLSGYQIFELPNSIGSLIHLRYLDLSRICIRSLPDSVTNLCNLQTLNLSNCENLTLLPANMWKLINLRHLYIEGTGLTEMPVEMSKLKDLQHLTNFVVSKDSGSGARIWELKELDHLCGSLSIVGLQNLVDDREALGANLKEKTRLEKLTLKWSGNSSVNTTGDSQNPNDALVLDKLRPPSSVMQLRIVDYQGIKFPNGFGEHSFLNIVSLTLEGSANCTSLPSLGQLPYLKALEIMEMKGIRKVGEEFYGMNNKPFQCLESLTFEKMAGWEEWNMVSGEEYFSRLSSLSIRECPKLRIYWPEQGEIVASEPMLMPLLTTLEIWGCEALQSLPVGMMRANTNARLRRLDMDRCSSLTSIGELPATLREIVISQCRNLEFSFSTQQAIFIEKLHLLYSCGFLTSLRLESFPNVASLNILGCENLETISIASAANGLQNLRELVIDSCPNLVSFLDGDGGGGLAAPNLIEFEVGNCKKLKSLPQQMCTLLTSLQSLQIFDCPELESFPDEGLPSGLRSLEIFNCEKLTRSRKDWDLHRLASLQKFIIKGEDSLESFPEECLLPTSLTSLHIGHLQNLISLNHSGLQHLCSLVSLSIHNCPQLLCLPEEGLPHSLSSLTIATCPLLVPRCQRTNGEDWPKIAHIGQIKLDTKFI